MRIARIGIFGALAALTAVMLSPLPGQAAVPKAFTIDFTEETAELKPNGYAAADAPGVLFFDTIGADLRVADFGTQSHGNAIRVGSDDASAIEIRLAGPTNSIKMAFGNDDPGFMDVTGQAQLTLFRGAVQVAQVLKNVNANDAMDQTIGFSGKLFNRAQFQYVDAAQTPVNLIEIIDDIKLSPMCTVTGSNGKNRLNGTAGSDVICGEGGNDIINGKGGADLILAGPGDDTVKGGGGGDKIVGDKGNDKINGEGGHDNISGGSGKDKLTGSSGKDVLNGGTQRDTCNGGAGRDRGPGCEVKVGIP